MALILTLVGRIHGRDGTLTPEQLAALVTESLDTAAAEWAAEQEYQRSLDSDAGTSDALAADPYTCDECGATSPAHEWSGTQCPACGRVWDTAE